MSLHPDLEVFLDMVKNGIDAGRLPMYMQTPSDARKDYDSSALLLDDCDDTIANSSDISIPCRDGYAVNARFYTPLVSSVDHRKPLPILIFYHGGGYCVGSLDSHDGLCRSITSKSSCAVLAVDYRLAPEYKFPTAFNDAVDSYLWLLKNSSKLGIDPNRIAVGGDSAGGTLATGLTIYLRDHALSLPRLQILLYPCTSAMQNTSSHLRYAQDYLLEAKTLEWMFDNYLANDKDRTDWRFAPLEADNLCNLPPAFIALAEYDPLLDEGIAYAKRLKDASVDTTLNIYSGMIHDFARFGNIISEANQIRDDIASELHTYLFDSKKILFPKTTSKRHET